MPGLSCRISEPKSLSQLLFVNNWALLLIKAKHKIFSDANIKADSLAFLANIVSNCFNHCLHYLTWLGLRHLENLRHLGNCEFLPLHWFEQLLVWYLLESAFLLQHVWGDKLVDLTVTNGRAEHVDLCDQAVKVGLPPHEVDEAAHRAEECVDVLGGDGLRLRDRLVPSVFDHVPGGPPCYLALANYLKVRSHFQLLWVELFCVL